MQEGQSDILVEIKFVVDIESSCKMTYFESLPTVHRLTTHNEHSLENIFIYAFFFTNLELNIPKLLLYFDVFFPVFF